MGKRTEPVHIELNQPIRFRCLVWHEDWEFDHPTLLLEPVVRYSESINSAEGLIEDVAIDICIDLQHANPIRHEDFNAACAWRGWKLNVLRRRAQEAAGGKRFPVKRYAVTDQWIMFQAENEADADAGDIKFIYVDPKLGRDT